MIRSLLAGLSLALVLTACASPTVTVSGGSDVPIPDDLITTVNMARADLAALLDTEDGFVVMRAENVIWPDGSLGCPQPDMSYTQALVDGYVIELSDGLVVYQYHGAVGRSPFLCQSTKDTPSAGSGDAAPTETLPTAAPDKEATKDMAEQPPTIEPGHNDPNLAGLVTIASSDLIDRLSVTLADVAVMSAEAVVWPDGSLGCPIPDMRYTQVQIEGARIVLSVDGGIYNYHSGGGRDPFLCVPTKPSDEGTTGLTLPGIPNSDE